MKKLLSLLLVVLLLSLSACGKSSESKYYGTWEITSAENNGAKFTLDELEALGDDSLSGISLILKEGGKACLLENGKGNIVDWSVTSDGLKIGVLDCNVENDTIYVEKNKVVLHFQKKSDSQEIPSGNASSPEVSSETSPQPSNITVGWRQFLKEYEEWVNDYIKIIEKYTKDPANASLLSDFTEMQTEMAEWETKTESIKSELENASPSELVEYSAELLRISRRIAEAAY